MPTLLDIPAELVELIAQQCCGRDVRNLRLVNREISGKVFKEYVNRHFSCRSVVLCDSDSLKQELAIARHPVFGEAIERLVFYMDEIEDEYYGTPRSDDWKDAAIRRQGEVRGGTGIVYLTSIIQELKQHGNLWSIGIADALRPSTPSGQYRRNNRISTYIKRARDIMYIPAGQFSLTHIAAAIVMHDVPICELTYDAGFCEVDAPRLGARSTVFAPIETLLQGLEMLRLNIIAHENADEECQSFVNLIARAPKLVSLELNMATTGHSFFGNAVNDEIIYRLLLQQKMPALKRLKLVNGTSSLEQIVEFSKNNAGLEKFIFQSIKTFEEDPDFTEIEKNWRIISLQSVHRNDQVTKILGVRLKEGEFKKRAIDRAIEEAEKRRDKSMDKFRYRGGYLARPSCKGWDKYDTASQDADDGEDDHTQSQDPDDDGVDHTQSEYAMDVDDYTLSAQDHDLRWKGRPLKSYAEEDQ